MMTATFHGPRNKSDFYSRYIAGEFGNHPRIWTSPEALVQSGYSGMISVRSLTPGGRMEWGLSVVEAVSRAWVGGVVFQEVMPDHELVIQGTLAYNPTGISLEYCFEPNLNFRQAMSRSLLLTGLQAHFLLKQYVDPPSLDDLIDLISRYPNAIIEFATFRIPVGIYPHRRTVIFEVREY